MFGRILDNVDPRFREQAEKAINKKDVLGILFSTGGNTQWLPLVFNCFSEFQDLGLVEKAFAEAFIATRVNNSNIPLSMFRAAVRFMDRDKLLMAGGPLTSAGPFTVYRGVSGIGARRRIKGFSWTGSLETAAWFACRYEDLVNPAVYQVTVEKKDVLWFTNERDEDEYVICLPDSVKPKRLKIGIQELKAMSNQVNEKRQEEQRRKYSAH